VIKIIILEENFKWHLEAFASELFKSFSESFGSFNELNEQIDSEKDSFILMKEFEQESHTEQSNASIELIKLKLFF